MADKQVRVTVKDFETRSVIQDLGVMSESRAEKVMMGLLINMNTENYFVDEEEVS